MTAKSKRTQYAVRVSKNGKVIMLSRNDERSAKKLYEKYINDRDYASCIVELLPTDGPKLPPVPNFGASGW